MTEIAIILLAVSAVLSAISQIVMTSTTRRLWQRQQRQELFIKKILDNMRRKEELK